jgi:ketosteroid isomerase-like protein
VAGCTTVRFVARGLPRVESLTAWTILLWGDGVIADSPEHAVKMVDAAFNRGDLEAVLDFYEAAAVVVMEPGKLARGKAELREFFERVMRSGVFAKQLKTNVIEAEGVALFLSRWTLQSPGRESAEYARTFVATTVLRKQPDGTWKALIDNSVGPLVLGS